MNGDNLMNRWRVRRWAVAVGARWLSAAVVTTAAVLCGPVPLAAAEPCPDVEVIFARGTGEQPGVGGIGQAFVDSVSSRVGSRSVGVYPVNYAASNDFGGGLDFARTVVDGIGDAGTHIAAMAANCPNTRMVLGGYSQGAALAGYVTSAVVPKEVPAAYAAYVPKPLSPDVANHVAAVTLFGTPSNQFLTSFGAPPIAIGPLYAPKTIEECAAGDTICAGDFNPNAFPLPHGSYAANGMVDQAADFAVGHL